MKTDSKNFYFVYLVIDKISKNVINGFDDQLDAIEYMEKEDPYRKWYKMESCSVYYKKAEQ